MPGPLGGGALGGLNLPGIPTAAGRSIISTPTTTILMKAPYAAPTLTISLKLPELSDADTYGLNINPLKMMDGSIKTYLYTPITEKFVWHFTQLTLSKWIELKDFLLFAQGKDIFMTDYNGIDRKVRCLNNILDFKFPGQGSGKTTVPQEGVSIDLEFEILG